MSKDILAEAIKLNRERLDRDCTELIQDLLARQSRIRLEITRSKKEIVNTQEQIDNIVERHKNDTDYSPF